MNKKHIKINTTIIVDKQSEGETIEQKIERIVNNNDAITDGAPIVYMERKDGVQAQFDIRTDRFDTALDAMDVVAKTKLAQRDQRQKEKSDKTETIQGTKPDQNPAA